MTDTSPTTPHAVTDTGVEDLDLTPDGLADAPAHEEDQESIVHTGNS
ncbi:hypothetical protein J7I84_10790 [Arthrobacter sp. ISL-85]|nr:hypothetical protein [Arthrobacter sp. ISL-85]MBT2566971.1 hypothetical protein [Arthrobacter sp. ISL-85]